MNDNIEHFKTSRRVVLGDKDVCPGMSMRKILKDFPTVFKPGYPTGRYCYMILKKDRKEVIKKLEGQGLNIQRVLGCGHDYNYHGDLYWMHPSK